jgi:DnaJ family protein A protein 2
MPTPYQVLGVARNASGDEIKKAYRKKALEHHPDKGGNPEVFKEVQHAYDIVGDETRRTFYDQTGSEQEEPGGPGGPGGMPFNPFGGMPFGGMPFNGGGPFGGVPFDMGQMFGGNASQHRKPPKEPKGPPKVHEMPLTLADYYYGKTVTIQSERQTFCTDCKGEGAESYENCRECNGSGTRQQVINMGPIRMMSQGPCGPCSGEGKKVSVVCRTCNGTKFISQKKSVDVIVEPGMRPHEVIVFPKECSDNERYVEAGDLHIALHQADEDIPFKRVTFTDDLSMSMTIKLSDTLIGGSQIVQGHPGYPDGLKVEIPVGVQNGTTFLVAGAGMPRNGTHMNGDLRVQVTLHVTNGDVALLKRNKEVLEGIFINAPLTSS